jgi:hypothetical protein
MVGSAAVAGFAVTMLIPSKEQRQEKRVLKRLAAIERAVAPRPVVATDGHDENNPAKHGVFKGLLNEALKAVRPAIMSAITAGISAKAVSDNDDEPQPPPDYTTTAGTVDVPPPT